MQQLTDAQEKWRGISVYGEVLAIVDCHGTTVDCWVKPRIWSRFYTSVDCLSQPSNMVRVSHINRLMVFDSQLMWSNPKVRKGFASIECTVGLIDCYNQTLLYFRVLILVDYWELVVNWCANIKSWSFTQNPNSRVCNQLLKVLKGIKYLKIDWATRLMGTLQLIVWVFKENRMFGNRLPNSTNRHFFLLFNPNEFTYC